MKQTAVELIQKLKDKAFQTENDKKLIESFEIERVQQLTAVEWLLEQLDVETVLTHRQLSDVINQAKEMEKEERQTHKYTEEDLRRAISFGQGMDLWKEEEKIEKFIQSINQFKQQEQ